MDMGMALAGAMEMVTEKVMDGELVMVEEKVMVEASYASKFIR